MNNLLRTCKCHWAEREYLHWGRSQRRKPFAAPGTSPKFAPDAPVTSQHMKLELHLDFQAERVWGKTTHRLQVQAPEVVEIILQAVALEIEGVKVNGKKVSSDHDGEVLTITLPRKFFRGKELSVEISHGVTKPVAGIYFTNPDQDYPERFQTAWSQGQDEDSRYYFPCLDHPNFKQTSEALLFVPAGFFALSNGDLVKHRPARGKGEALWHYKLDLPYSTYLFSVVAGRFAEHREGGNKRGQNKVGKNKVGNNKVEVRWFVQEGREREGQNAFGATAKILDFFSNLTGHPYPYRQYTQIAVPDFIFGGMENFTVTTQTDLTLHDDRAHLDFSSDDLVAHEAAHTWFGNMVTARSWAHAWLHESFATYLETLYTRQSKGVEEADFELLRNGEAYFREDEIYRRPLVTHRYEFPIDLFDAHLYPGGAVRLRHLHSILGDKAFRGAIKRFLGENKFGLVETVDLARAVEAETGLNYDWWFDQWIFSAGYPALELSFSWQEKEKVATVIIKQTQPLVTSEGGKKPPAYFRLPSQLAFQVGENLEEFPVTIEGAESRFLFRLDRKPKMALLDPRFEIPVKRVKLKLPQDLLIHQLAHAKGAIARIEAATTLAEKPSQVVIKALARQLKREKFWGVQQRIAIALRKIGGSTARDVLLSALKTPHPKARRAVISSLGFFKDDPKVAGALEKKIQQGDQSYYVESEVARALGRCRAPKAREILANSLADSLDNPSHNDTIRAGVMDGLAELADPEALPDIAEALRYGAPALSRPAAIRAAASLGRRHQHLRKEILDLLRGVAEHKENPAATFRGRLASLRALGALGDLDGLPILRRVAETEADSRVVRLARETAISLREQSDKPAEMNTLRTDVDLVVKENKSLRDRLEVLEKKPAPKKPTRKKKAPKKSAAKKKARP